MEYLNQPGHSRAQSLISQDKLKKRERVASAEPKANLEEKKETLRVSSRTKQGVLSSNPTKPNQDSFATLSNEQKSLYLLAVADGHGAHGHHVSQLAVKRLTSYFH